MFERVAYSTDIGEFVLMNSLLESNGIEVLQMMHAGHVSIAGIDHGFYVQVRGSQSIRARRLLSDSEFRHCIVEAKTR